MKPITKLRIKLKYLSTMSECRNIRSVRYSLKIGEVKISKVKIVEVLANERDARLESFSLSRLSTSPNRTVMSDSLLTSKRICDIICRIIRKFLSYYSVTN